MTDVWIISDDSSSSDDEIETVRGTGQAKQTVTVKLPDKSVQVNLDMNVGTGRPNNNSYNRALLQYNRDGQDIIMPFPEHEAFQRSIHALTHWLLAIIAIQNGDFTTDIVVRNEAEPAIFNLDQYTYVSQRRKFKCTHVSPKPIHNTQYAVLYLAEFENGKYGVISRRVPDVIKIDLPSPSEASKAAVLQIANAQQSNIVFSVGTHDISRESLLRLLGEKWTHDTNFLGWVDDGVINAYFGGHIQRRSESNHSLPRVKCSTSFFITYCTGYTNARKLPHHILKSVSPGSTGSNISEVDLVLFPINASMRTEAGTHWLLIVANMRKKELQVYDSYGNSYNGSKYWPYIKALFELDSRGANNWFNADEWKIVNMKTSQQDGGIDCGVFMCKIADAISQDQPIQINRHNVNDMRMIIATELYEKRDMEE